MKITRNILLIIMLLVCVCLGFVSIFGDEVLNELDKALLEMQDIETKGLLSNTPKNTSAIKIKEIALVKNFQKLKNYIKETEANVNLYYNLFMFCSIAFIIIALFKLIYKFRQIKCNKLN